MGSDAGHAPEAYGHTEDSSASSADMQLPLKLGSLGILASGKFFDDKIPLQKEFQFNGKHGGDSWKGKAER